MSKVHQQPIRRSTPFVMVAVVLALTWVSADAVDLATYRTFTLGAPTADVIARTGSTPQSVMKVHERPAVLEELSWRLPSGNLAERESVSTITFSFIDNQLFRMVVGYDKGRTEGLSRQDMIASLSAIYGPRSTATAPAAAKSASEGLDAVTALARWAEGETMVVLGHSAYSGGFTLTITSTRLEALARKAASTAVTLDAREAPAREAARVRAQADAERAAAEKIRTSNKATFTP